jgi:putative hemolysin
MSVSWELFIILALVLANGFFAAAEIAILTARRSRLEPSAQAGDRKAKTALDLARNPDRFLPTVQVGITLVATLASVFGGARVVETLKAVLVDSPVLWVAAYRETIALSVVVLGISSLSLLFGELVPKRLALVYSEGFARFVARPIQVLAQVARPVVWALGMATEGILVLLRSQKPRDTSVSVEDIEHMIRAGTREGVLEPAEQMVARKALRLNERTVSEIMRPRTEMDALEVHTPPEEVIGAVAMTGFSRLPVYEGDLDNVVGFVYAKDLLRQQHLGWEADLSKLIRPALFVPETLPIDKLIELFRENRTQMAIVVDEYGGTEGLATLEDVLEELVGEIHDEHRRDDEQEIVARDENSWSVDAGVNLDDFLERIGLAHLQTELPGDFNTLGGLVLALLNRIPGVGDRAKWNGLDLEVVDMDGRRIDRLIVTRIPDAEAEKEDAETHE